MGRKEVYHLSKSIIADQVHRALAPYVRGFVRIGVHGHNYSLITILLTHDPLSSLLTL